MSERDFSPALRSAIQQIQQEANRRIEQILRDQVNYLDLPEGSKADLEHGRWVVPEEDED